MTTKGLDLVNKDNSMISKIKKLQENVRKQPNNNVEDKVPEITIISQDPKKINKPIKPIEDHAGVNKENIENPEEPEEEIPTENQPVEEDVESIGGEKARTPPFLLTLEMLNHKVHNCLVDFGSQVNVMPLAICQKINGQPKPTAQEVIQLDRTSVKVVGEMKNVLVRLSANNKICQFIDVKVVDILDGYGLILN